MCLRIDCPLAEVPRVDANQVYSSGPNINVEMWTEGETGVASVGNDFALPYVTDYSAEGREVSKAGLIDCAVVLIFDGKRVSEVALRRVRNDAGWGWGLHWRADRSGVVGSYMVPSCWIEVVRNAVWLRDGIALNRAG